MMRAAKIAERAKEELAHLTGLDVDTISALEKNEEVWHVTVSLVELKRIPEASDLLGSYEILLDDEGELVSYRRTRRYCRGEVMEEAQ